MVGVLDCHKLITILGAGANGSWCGQAVLERQARLRIVYGSVSEARDALRGIFRDSQSIPLLSSIDTPMRNLST